LFFLSDPSPAALYTLSLHDALPISGYPNDRRMGGERRDPAGAGPSRHRLRTGVRRRQSAASRLAPDRLKEDATRWRRLESKKGRSEEHTSELQSRFDLVCRLLLEKK